jgi:PAS domain S-box-containing protein
MQRPDQEDDRSIDELRARVAVLEAENAELRTASALLNAIATNAPAVIYVKDLSLRFLLSNQLHATLLGVTPREVVGKREADLLPEDAAAEIDRVALEIISSGEPRSSVFDVDIQGKPRSFLELMFPIRDDLGQIIALGGISNDITDRQEAQRALAANKAKSQFLATMSHEIRTPMNGILGMTRFLSDTNLSERQRDFVDVIATSCDSLLTIINDILDFSKIEAGKLDLERTPVNVRACFHHVTSLMSRIAAEKGIALDCHIANDVPEQIQSDATRLRQILLNLMSNAVKFTPAGRVSVTARVTTIDSNRTEIHTAITDTGIGIPADRLANLFEAFEQGDASMTRQFGGTGLGLTIGKRLVELMGGRMWVESKQGVGSTFHFTIIADVIPIAPVVTQTPEAFVSEVKQPLAILLAEDNHINRRVATLMLKKLGYEIDMATTGLEAFDKARLRTYDVILMDMQMPDMDGVQATRKIRSELPNSAQPYIIALTANVLQESQEACLRAGMNDFVTKPLDLPKLTAALARAAAQVKPNQ